MIESIKQLRKETQILNEYNNIDTHELEKIADAIEREVEERYIEGPTDKNGDPITYSTKTHQWGTLEDIVCEMYPDGTYEWFVRGHGVPAPLEKAKHVTVVKPSTVEDVLREFALEIDPASDVDVSGAKTIAEYAKRLQLKEAE